MALSPQLPMTTLDGITHTQQPGSYPTPPPTHPKTEYSRLHATQPTVARDQYVILGVQAVRNQRLPHMLPSRHRLQAHTLWLHLQAAVPKQGGYYQPCIQ